MGAESDSRTPRPPEAGGGDPGVRVLISVMGLPHQLKWAYYRVRGKRVRSRLATAPLLAELLGGVEPRDVRLVLLAPHSLVPVCDDWRALLSAGDMESLTEGIARGAAGFVRESLERVAEDLGEGDEVAERLRRLLRNSSEGSREWLRVAVVQVKGSFPLGGARRGPVLEFDGDPTHAFVEVYRILKQIHRERRVSGICVDLSHGWNFLSVLAYLGAAAFRDAYLPDLRLEVKSSEPYTPLASVQRRKDKGEDCQKRSSEEDELDREYALGLIDVEPAAATLRLVRDAAAVRAIPHRSLSFQDMLFAYEAAEKELGSLPEAARRLVESAALLRKVSCGLHLGIIPYLHWSLTLLGDLLPELRGTVEEVESLFGDSAYLRAELAEGRVSYRERPPLTYVLMDVLVRSLEELWNELSVHLRDPDGISRYSITPGFVESLRRYYMKRGMGATLSLTDVELGYLAAADHGVSVGGLPEIINLLLDLGQLGRPVSGISVAYPLKWIGNLRDQGPQSMSEQIVLIGSLRRDLSDIPLYGIYSMSGREQVNGWLRDYIGTSSQVSPSQLLAHAREIWENLADLAEKLENCSGDDRWLRNFSLALDLVLDRQVELQQVKDLVRNMMAHVGLQHFTVASIFADFDGAGRLEDLRIVYLARLFESLDRRAAECAFSNSQMPTLADRLRSEFADDPHLLGCLCDLAPPGRTP